jgi:two-component system LytT family sensor kinase
MENELAYSALQAIGMATDMEKELTRPALQAIGMAAGAALCASLGLMQFRVDRATGGPSGYQLLWVVGFIWTLGRFLRYMLQLAGLDEEANSVRLAEALAWSCTILGPIAIGRLLQARMGTASRLARAFLVFTAAASILNLSLFAWVARTRAFDLDASWYPEASLYVALIVTAVALILHRLGRHDIAPAGSRPRWFGRGAFLLAALQVGAALLSLRSSWLPTSVHAALSLIGEHWAIPWSILIAVSLAQIHYADVVLKRSLWLLASVSISTLASTFVFDVPPGFALVVATLSCAALMLSAPLLIRALNFLIDRVYLDRADYLAAASLFEESVRRVYDREQLFDAALLAVRSTLRVDARWVPAGDVAAAPTNALASIPIETGNRPGYRLEVSASHHARSLLAEELGFLNAVGTHVSRRLDAIYFEQEQRALHVREERLKRLLSEAELKALRTQVDPHFLFNTLNTIADLIGSQPLRAERMTERLAECFRYALSRHARELSTLDDELEFARHYLDIEQERFGDRLRVELSRGDAHGNESVPSLLLQPLLENAIRHGLAPLREGGCISVAAKREGEYLRLQVDDDGVGLRPDFQDRPGVGLRNVTERLHAMYAQAARFAIGSRPGGRGTSVTVLVPLHGN